ncbi:MAG: aspartate/glutamate racemase family protein [bacterium]
MIGVFDTGIGGLSVLRVLRRAFPRANFLYLGDTARVPYGSRSEETIRQFSREGAMFLKSRGADIAIIACNTVSAVARDVFVEVFDLSTADTAKGTVPLGPKGDCPLIIDVISPTIEAIKTGGYKNVAVIGTSATVGSHVYARRLQEIGLSSIREIACPLFVPIVEEGFEKHTGARAIADTYLAPLANSGLEALILGCTHFPFMEATIASVVGKKVELVESGPAVLNYFREGIVKEIFSGELFDGDGELTLALTDARIGTVDLARKWLGEDVKVEKVML